MKGAGSVPLGISVICLKCKLPKLKKQLPRRKLTTSYEEALSKVIFTFIFNVSPCCTEFSSGNKLSPHL